MTEDPATREITVVARRENLEALRDFVARACERYGVSEHVSGQLQLAVDEVCTNLVLYAYQEAGGDIRLAVDREGDRIVVAITDWGPPFDPNQAPAPDLTSGWEERRIGGLGWHLVRKVTDEIDYRADPERGNVLRLIKNLPSGQATA